VSEARGRLAGARVLAADNPVIEGVRSSDPSRTTLELTVPLGGGLRRSRRIAEARFGVEQEEFLEADARLRVVGEALDAYYEVLHAEQHLAIANDRRELASDLVGIAADRLEAGDAARLEVLVAESELSRAESEVLARRRDVTESRRQLATLLGLPSGAALEVAGDLRDRTLLDAVVAPTAKPRADVLAAERHLKAANAAVSLAGAWPIPDVSFRLNYERAESDDVFSPGLALSIPLFDRGQGARAEARARRERATIQLEALRAMALAQTESARAAYAGMSASAREIEERALPRALEVESLARQSYEAGKLDLPSFLLVRSGALDTRREHADRLLEAARTGIDFAVALGALPQQP
jgi:cobalt-zinc-cadmium efflux system outer membrane protein